MLYEEAIWVGNEIKKILAEKGKVTVLNIGSSKPELLKVIQPYIESNIHNPIRESGSVIYNTDIKDSDEVDFIGDMEDEVFVKDLASKDFDIVLCTNMLEHVKSPATLCANIGLLMRKGSYAIVTVPRTYPYHPDPEDYLFRPTSEVLSKMFDGTDCISAACIKGRRVIMKGNKSSEFRNFAEMLWYDPRLAIITFVRLLVPFYRFYRWKKTAFYMPRLFKHFSVSCIVVRKK